MDRIAALQQSLAEAFDVRLEASPRELISPGPDVNPIVKLDIAIAGAFEEQQELGQHFLAIVNDWQAPRTKSLKRFLLGVGVIVSGAGWVQASLDNFSPFGIKASQGNATALAMYLFAVIALTWIAFELSYRVDSASRKERISRFDEIIKTDLSAHQKVRAAMIKNNATEDDLKNCLKVKLQDGYMHQPKAPDKFATVDRYFRALHPASKTNKFLDHADRLIVGIIAAMALFALLPFLSTYVPWFGIRY